MIFGTPPLECDIRQQPAFRLQLDRRRPLIEESAAARDEAFEIGIDRNQQHAAPLKLLLNYAGDEAYFEGAIAPADDDPHVTRTQPVAQLG